MHRDGINNALKVLVTLGLGTGYAIVIRKQIRQGDKVSALGNSILLPSSLIWLWLISNNGEGEKK